MGKHHWISFVNSTIDKSNLVWLIFNGINGLGFVVHLSFGRLAPGNPRNLFSLSDSVLDFTLQFDLEGSVGHVVDSGVVSLGFLLSGNLGEHDWCFLEFGIKFDRG